MDGWLLQDHEEQVRNFQDRNFMMDYVINLLDDAHDCPWATAKTSNAILFCIIEQGGVSGMSDTENIDRIRRAHAQRNVAPNNNFLTTGTRTPQRQYLCILTKMLAG